MQFIENTFYKLFAPSEKFFKAFLLGKAGGRKLELWDYFRNYFFHFKNIATNIFEYTGIEKELAHEIEERLFFFGRCGIIEDNGKLWAVDCNPYGYDRYGYPTHFNFTFKNGTTIEGIEPIEINVNGVYGMNTRDIYPTSLYAEQYAFQLAHADTSIACELVNSRMVDVIIAHNNANAESANNYINDIYRGKFSYITDKTEEIEIDRTPKGVGHLKDYIDTKDRFLKDSYETFGIKKLAEKRERMITGEVESTHDLLNLNLKEMYECRKKMCDDLKIVFGVNADVISHVDMDGDGEIEKDEFKKGGNENV